MAGIYVHVPFCKTRCIYCDFFTRTDTRQKGAYVDALCKELSLRADYLDDETIDTVYFGGGTPSQLSVADLSRVLSAVKENFEISPDAEITLEANPDDLDPLYLTSLPGLGFNRLSLGVQSFDDSQLKFLNRRHSARKALDSIALSKKSGFDNISIDLMYGLPGLSIDSWSETLDRAIDCDIQHISSYHLIYEEGTPLFDLLKKDKIRALDEDTSLEMFSLMIDKLHQAGFIHYEISNFGKEGYFSRHNTSYWQDAKYLGIGPSAHSYDLLSRSWNVSSIRGYIEAIKSGQPKMEKEILDTKSKYNDYILTRLRTMWGINSFELEERFGEEFLNYFLDNIHKHIENGCINHHSGNYKLNKQGIFISDSIMSDLMFVG